ncbi:MAG TPA: hypothetical protein VGB50_00410 [Flavobacterium sp.]
MVTLFANVGVSSEDGTGLYAFAVNQEQQALYVGGTENTPGTYATPAFTIEGSGIWVGGNIQNDVQFVIINYGDVGEYVDMTFSGTYSDPTGTHTITGTVHAIRDN